METAAVQPRLQQDYTTNSYTQDEADENDYLREVLQLVEGETEDALDYALENEAAAAGIPTANPPRGNCDHSLCESIITSTTGHARTGSTASQNSFSTKATTPRSSNEKDVSSGVSQHRQDKRASVSFSEYERFLAKTSLWSAPPTPRTPISPGVSTYSLRMPSLDRLPESGVLPPKKSGLKFRHGFRNLSNLMNKTKKPKDSNCISCQKDLKKTHTLLSLPCGHVYCNACLRDLVQQAILAESRMPPKCCSVPLSVQIVKAILSRNEQAAFMKSFQQYSTPWNELVFCPNSSCGEFVPKLAKLDPRHPFQLNCRECGTKVCTICKQQGHETAAQCPLDWELEAVLQVGEGKGWRRCYNCQNLVKVNKGCSTYITCRCKAKFCYTCGAVWDCVSGCPNDCYAFSKAEKVEDMEARRRADSHPRIRQFLERRTSDQNRFCTFELERRKQMWARHAQMKVDLLDRFAELEGAMEQRHKEQRTKQETKHLMKEAELLEEQAQYRRMVHATIRHMETYCERVALAPSLLSGSESDISSRSSLASESKGSVTEKERMELKRQYRTRADIPRRQESEINVMRGKQERQVDELEAKQQSELEGLARQRREEMKRLRDVYSQEEEKLASLFGQKKERVEHRWFLKAEILRRGVEKTDGLPYAPVPPVDWPKPAERPSALSLDEEKEKPLKADPKRFTFDLS